MKTLKNQKKSKVKTNIKRLNLLEYISSRFFILYAKEVLILTAIRILYISVSGNTRNFVNNLQKYAEQLHVDDETNPLIKSTEISDQSDFADEKENFFAFVPTYLDGGNGIDNGVKEMMTNALGEYIDYHNNARRCLGIIGSGNKNFNEQYCLTAKRYAQKFNTEFTTDFELRGTDRDVERVYNILKNNNI